MFSVIRLLPTPPDSPRGLESLNADAVQIPRQNLTLDLLKEKLTEYLETIEGVFIKLPYKLKKNKKIELQSFKVMVNSWFEETLLFGSLEEEAEKWIDLSADLVKKIDELPPLIWES